MSQKLIPVTKPYLPPLEEFIPMLRAIWDERWLTNNGPFHQRLEKALAHHLGVEHLALFANGTLALVTALQVLRITGEVITTPYSFVATAHSLLWNKIKPVFVDIEAASMTIDPDRIEAAITPSTSAILAVHCYGHPCNVERIRAIADTYGLRVIYDAAHAFGVRYRGEPLVRHGDLSVLSFHATKVFNTFEGGAIVCPDGKVKKRVDFLKNFGISDEVTVVAPGINGKMNEFQAALGLLQLEHIGEAIRLRREVDRRYREMLRGVPGLQIPLPPAETEWNYAYFPVLIGREFETSRDGLYERLREAGVHARRYFYPLISEQPMYRGLPSAKPANLSVAKEISARILCLPIYPDLSEEDQNRVVKVIRGHC